MSTFIQSFLFVGLPYLALFAFFYVSIQRYKTRPFTYSSLSSQVLENDQHFYGLVPFHYGIIAVLLGHLLAFLVPSSILAWNANPLRLLLLELTGFALAGLAAYGLGNMIVRRLTNLRVQQVTTPADWALYAVLAVQIITGMTIALFYRWGSSWFAAVMTPYLWSIFTFQPDATAVYGMPLIVKLHIANAWLFILVFPFTRMVHVLVAPFHYFLRKPQVVRWSHARQLAERKPQ